MTSISRLLEHPVALQLGLVLAHFLWQGVAVALLALVALTVLRRARAATRYLVCYGLLLVMALCPVVTFRTIPDESPLAAVLAHLTTESTSVVLAAVQREALTSPPTSASPEPIRGSSPRERLADQWAKARPRLAWLAAGWAIGVALLSVRLLVRWYTILVIGRRASRPADAHWDEVVARLSRRLAVRRAVRLLRSASIAAPLVMGWLRPMVLLPPSVLTGLTPMQLEAVLAHELAHIRRHDYLANLIQTVIETVLFYHPAVWWLSRRIRQEREHCCDDLAVSVCGDAVAYGRALAELEQLRQALVVQASGGSLVIRTWRLIGAPTARGRSPGWSAVSAWAAGLMSLLLVLHAATTPALAAEHRLSYDVIAAYITDADAPPQFEAAQRWFAKVRVIRLIVRGKFEPRGEGSEGEARQAVAEVLRAAGLRVVTDGPADAEVLAVLTPRPGPADPGFDDEQTKWPGEVTLVMQPATLIRFLCTESRGLRPSDIAIYPGWRVAKECARQSTAALINHLDPGRIRALLLADDPAVRASAFAIIASTPGRGRQPPPTVLDLLVQAVQDKQEDLAVRVLAARGLGKATYAPRQAAAPLLAALADRHEQPHVRASAAAALIDLAASAKFLYADVIAVLRDREPLVRQAAALSLSSYGTWEADGVDIYVLGDEAQELDTTLARLAIRPLVECLRDRDARVRSAALSGLRGVGYPYVAVPALIKLLADPDPALRKKAANALAATGSDATPVVSALSRLLKDPVPDVRKSAAIALLQLGGLPSPRVLKALGRPDTTTGKAEAR
jgi:beta-lactamase regulating signal transducer with metallopeptidase domain/HEAT repeat protein